MKWFWRILASIVLLAVLAVGALFLIPTDRIAALATQRFEAATGRSLDLDGGVRASLWPVLGVTAGSVRLGNSDWAGPEPMLEAARVAIGIDPTTLFGDIRVTSIEIEDPVIRLAVNEGGQGNWEFGRAGGDAPASTGSTELPALDSAKVKGGTVIFQGADGATIRLDDIDLSAAFPDVAGPAEVSLTGRSGAAPFGANARIAQLSAFVNGQRVPVEADMTAGGATASLRGTAGLAPLQVDGAMTASARDLAGLFALLGSQAPALPPGLGRNEIAITSEVALSGNTLTLAALDATLDQNRVRGKAQIVLGGARPVIDAELNLGQFDLSAMATGGGAQSGPGGATTGWSKERIDLSALGLLDGRIAVEAAGLRFGTSSIDALSTVTTIENARAVTEIARLRAYDGTAAGTLVLNARESFSTRLNVAGSAFAISRLLAELVGYDRLVAAGNLRLNVLGAGNTMDALMNSLNGDGSFHVGAGELLGVDIVGLLRSLDPSFLGKGQTTIFDEITGTFRIVNGTVINDDLRLTAPLFRATGSGQIGIGAQSLDLSVIPELLGGENAGIKVPLRITGSWQNPKVGLDLEGALKSKVEEEVRGRVEKKIQEKVDEKLEDTLKKGLGDLLKR